VRVGVDPEFVVAAADVLNERMTCADRLDGTQAFQAAHRPEPCFQAAVIGFDPVVLPVGVDVAGLGE
jgi:hypothetical protein